MFSDFDLSEVRIRLRYTLKFTPSCNRRVVTVADIATTPSFKA